MGDFRIAFNQDRLLKREKWAETRWDGSEKENPRVVYNIGGERAEFDSRVSDRIVVNDSCLSP